MKWPNGFSRLILGSNAGRLLSIIANYFFDSSSASPGAFALVLHLNRSWYSESKEGKNYEDALILTEKKDLDYLYLLLILK